MDIKENEKKEMHNLEIFLCNKCNYSTNKPSLWIKHTSTKKHEKKILETENTLPFKKEFYCECCKITVYHKTNWDIHINSYKHKREGKPKSVECTICNQKFINHITQKHHMLSAHSTKEERSKEKYYCDICDYVFISKLYMESHIAGKFHNCRVKAFGVLEELNKIKYGENNL